MSASTSKAVSRKTPMKAGKSAFARKEERAAKLKSFAGEAVSMCALKCFRYFEMYARGKEEVIVFVKGSPSRLPLTKVQDPILILPPETPITSEPTHITQSSDRVTFLIGSYSNHELPYVWCRSSVGDFVGDDTPIELGTIEDWDCEDIYVVDVIEELVTLVYSTPHTNALISSNVYIPPPPENVFEVDIDALKQLPKKEQLLISGALLHFLKDLYLETLSKEVLPLIQNDIAALSELHFTLLGQVFAEGE